MTIRLLEKAAILVALTSLIASTALIGCAADGPPPASIDEPTTEPEPTPDEPTPDEPTPNDLTSEPTPDPTPPPTTDDPVIAPPSDEPTLETPDDLGLPNTTLGWALLSTVRMINGLDEVTPANLVAAYNDVSWITLEEYQAEFDEWSSHGTWSGHGWDESGQDNILFGRFETSSGRWFRLAATEEEGEIVMFAERAMDLESQVVITELDFGFEPVTELTIEDVALVDPATGDALATTEVLYESAENGYTLTRFETVQPAIALEITVAESDRTITLVDSTFSTGVGLVDAEIVNLADWTDLIADDQTTVLILASHPRDTPMASYDSWGYMVSQGPPCARIEGPGGADAAYLGWDDEGFLESKTADEAIGAFLFVISDVESGVPLEYAVTSGEESVLVQIPPQAERGVAFVDARFGPTDNPLPYWGSCQ